MNELDVVIAKKRLSERIEAGCKGVIVMVYHQPSLAYEVEFFDNNEETIDVITVEEEAIELERM